MILSILSFSGKSEDSQSPSSGAKNYTSFKEREAV